MGYKGHLPMIQTEEESMYIHPGPGVVYWISCLVSTGDGRVVLRDGSDGDAPVLITVERDAGEPQMTRFAPVLPFKTGLYVERVDHIDEYTVCFDPLEE